MEDLRRYTYLRKYPHSIKGPVAGPVTYPRLMAEAGIRIIVGQGPFSTTIDHKNVGRARKPYTISRLASLMKTIESGIHVQIRDKKDGLVFQCRRIGNAVPSFGDKIEAWGKANLGHCYSFSGVWPNCSDCSGTTMEIYARFVGIVLSHRAMSQFTDLGGQVGPFPRLGPGKMPFGEVFLDESKCMKGDLVWKSYVGFASPSNNPDHVGVWMSKDRMLDMRSPSEPLNFRAIYSDAPSSQTLYGRYYKANGHLK